jgi:DNA primase
MEARNTTAGYPAVGEDRRLAIRRHSAKLKEAISLEDYLHTRGVEVRRNRARCIVHGGDNPSSFSVDPERQLWNCFGCGHGGDLITLVELAERHGDRWTAIISLAQQFDIELPRKSDKWHEWQSEKGRRRKMLRAAIAASYQRRFFRLFRADIEMIEDPDEREAEARALWESIRPLAVSCAERRMQA